MGKSGLIFKVFNTHPNPLTLTLILISWTAWRGVEGYSEICVDDNLLQVSAKDCPGGVVFRSKQKVSCTYPDPDDRGHLSDLCGDYAYNPNSGREIQFVDTGSNDDGGVNSDKYTSKCVQTCTTSSIIINSQNTIGGEGQFENEDAPDPPDDQNPPTTEQKAGLDQTMRLFMYMTGHLIDENPQGPDIRLVQLLGLSYQVLRKHCNPEYLPLEFTEDIQKAFLYLLRESDTGHIRDVPLADYKNIQRVLEKCVKAPAPKPFSFEGTQCKPLSKIKNIIQTKKAGRITTNSSTPYTPNVLSFKWGQYDFPVDATWGALDFTHGLCYGVFNLDPNSHHLYQRAVEGLFTREVEHRWRNPPKLKQHYYWDHMFRSKVKTAMHNLDACIQATYLDNPFLHRLRRSWVTKADVDAQANNNNNKRRRKRSITSNAWCLQTVSEKDNVRGTLCKS